MTEAQTKEMNKLADLFQSQPEKQGVECMWGYARTGFIEGYKAAISNSMQSDEVDIMKNQIEQCKEYIQGLAYMTYNMAIRDPAKACTNIEKRAWDKYVEIFGERP